MKRIYWLGTGVVLLGCLYGCPPTPPPGPPQGPPKITWRITAYTSNGTKEIPINQPTDTKSLGAQSTFSVSLFADDPSGIGNMSANGAIVELSCDYKWTYCAGGSPGGSHSRCGTEWIKVAGTPLQFLQTFYEHFSGAQVTTHQSILWWFNQTDSKPLCPAHFYQNKVVPYSGSIIFFGTAADAADPALAASGTL